MTQIVYSTTATPLAAGRTYRNPRYFAGPESGVERVYVVGGWPGIVAAYVAAGVDVVADGVVKSGFVAGGSDFGPLATAFAANKASDEPVQKMRRRRR